MQPNLRNPRVGDRVIILPGAIRDELGRPNKEPLPGVVRDAGRFVFNVMTDTAGAYLVSTDQFNLDPNCLR